MGKRWFSNVTNKNNCTAIAENKDECESNNIIKEKLESPIITYYTLKNYIDTNNYENPYVRGIQETFYYVSYKKFISATEYLKHVQIHSDVGLIFNTEETKADSTVDSLVDYFETDQEDGKIFTMTLQLTNNMDIYGRRYYKIQDLGADIGAIYGVLRLIFSTLMEFYNTSKLFTNIINTFFSIKEEYKPHSKDKKTFINLRAKFFKGIKLNNSFEENNYIINQLNESRNNNRFVKFKSSLNTGNIKKNKSRNKNLFTEENTSNYKSTENINNSNNADHIKIKKNYIIKTSYKKKKENNKIKIKFSSIDKLFCLYIIDLCRNKVNKYSYYNLFYKGKDYLIKILDVKNYLVINSFVQMFFLINRREKKHIFNYITKPILSCNYVGTKLENENNLTI